MHTPQVFYFLKRSLVKSCTYFVVEDILNCVFDRFSKVISHCRKKMIFCKQLNCMVYYS